MMTRNLSIAIVVTILPILLLYLWRLTYRLSDYAAVWLVLLAAMIFCSNWSIVIARWTAERGIILRPDSWLSRWFSGRIGAFISSALLVVVLIPTLAWHALTMSIPQAVVMAVLFFCSAWFYLGTQAFLSRHILPPFDQVIATGRNSWLIGFPFAIVLFFVTWYTANVPVGMLSATFPEAIGAAMQQLPQRRGWIAEVLSFGYAFEAAKLWLVVQMRDYPLIALIFNLDIAILGFLTARASIVITHFIEAHYHSKAS